MSTLIIVIIVALVIVVLYFVLRKPQQSIPNNNQKKNDSNVDTISEKESFNILNGIYEISRTTINDLFDSVMPGLMPENIRNSATLKAITEIYIKLNNLKLNADDLVIHGSQNKDMESTIENIRKKISDKSNSLKKIELSLFKSWLDTKQDSNLNSTEKNNSNSDEKSEQIDTNSQKIKEIRDTSDIYKLRKLLVDYSDGWLKVTRESNYTANYEDFDNYPYLREIGEQAYKIGGMSFMQKVCRDDNGGYLSDDWSDYFWQGLHGWQA